MPIDRHVIQPRPHPDARQCGWCHGSGFAGEKEPVCQGCRGVGYWGPGCLLRVRELEGGRFEAYWVTEAEQAA